jgi:hypothetical protein
MLGPPSSIHVQVHQNHAKAVALGAHENFQRTVVFARHPQSLAGNSTAYFEVQIISADRETSVGLRGVLAYKALGELVDLASGRCTASLAGFGDGDVVGIGVHRLSPYSGQQRRQHAVVFFTLNGVELTSMPRVEVDPCQALVPVVTFVHARDEILARFEPGAFAFDPALYSAYERLDYCPARPAACCTSTKGASSRPGADAMLQRHLARNGYLQTLHAMQGDAGLEYAQELGVLRGLVVEGRAGDALQHSAEQFGPKFASEHTRQGLALRVQGFAELVAAHEHVAAAKFARACLSRSLDVASVRQALLLLAHEPLDPRQEAHVHQDRLNVCEELARALYYGSRAEIHGGHVQ